MHFLFGMMWLVTPISRICSTAELVMHANNMNVEDQPVTSKFDDYIKLIGHSFFMGKWLTIIYMCEITLFFLLMRNICFPKDDKDEFTKSEASARSMFEQS
jgi:hypothetical protein